jgi:ABC-type nickel/cobalt efflux system permease component RcnA
MDAMNLMLKNAIVIGLLGTVMFTAPAAAHPMGNFSVNQYFLVDQRTEAPIIYYLVDIAEIPSFTELDLLDTDFDSQVTKEEEQAYLDLRVPQLYKNLTLHSRGQPVPIQLSDYKLVLLEGMGGMVVFNILLTLNVFEEDAPLLDFDLTSRNFEDESGTRECKVYLGGRFNDVTADLGRETLEYQTLVLRDDEGNPVYQDFDAQFLLRLTPIDGVAPMTDVEPLAFEWTATARGARDTGEQAIADSLSRALSDIVEDAAERPDIVAENVDVPRTSPAGTPVERALDEIITTSRRNVAEESDREANMLARVSELIRSKELSPPLFLLGLAIAAAMGMGHAFSPGHGKTVMAAYLIGERGTSWHALVLGIIVTITHTWSILLLGIVVLYAGETISEEQLQFWTGIASGLIIVGLGVVLFQRRYRTYVLAKYGMAGHSHGGHDHHHHHGDDEDHGHSHVVETEDGAPPTYGSILWLGISGGIVPCPAALIVLLLALKFGRLFYGLWLIVAFSIGLAAVLVAIGIVVVRTAGAVRERTKSRPGILLALPVFSSALITVLGGWIVFWTLIQFEVLVILPGG